VTYITDHAVLRYLERVKGVDIEAIRAEMAAPGLEIAGIIGCGVVRMANGARLKLSGDVVSTVTIRHHKGSPKHRHAIATGADAGIPERQPAVVHSDSYIPEGC
jgi:hypothetical protein